jgi:ribonuclease J
MKVRIIALGGLYEIGKNTWCFECEDEIMLIDAGLAFPTVDMIGVDIVLPKLNYLVANKDRIKGMIVTHGHEDHIGGIVPLLKEVNVPIIYAPGLALALIKNKLKDAHMEEQKLQLIKNRDKVNVGQYFKVQYVRNNHSIADSFSLIIDSPEGRIVHSGDFKFDHSPIDKQFFDVPTLAKAGEEGVTLLLSDSTNAEKPTYTPSEKAVIPKIKEYIHSSSRRVFITTFASQVHRVKLIMQIALQAGKKLCIFGRSMITLASISKDLGYIEVPDDFIVRQEDINKIPANELVILTTGSQGEQFAALSRIARNEHKYLQIQPGDTVIISSSAIPGNEKGVNNLINQLFSRGAEVIYGSVNGVHVSGHASQEEQKILLNLVKPKYFMPCHGEYRMLVKHGELGVKCGVAPENIFLLDNGDVLEIENQKCSKKNKVEAGLIMVDNANVGELDSAIMLERRLISNEGLLTVLVTLNSYAELVSEPIVYSRGMILAPKQDKASFLKKISQITEEAIKNSNHKNDLSKLELDVKSEIHKFVDTEMHKHPLLELILMEYSGSPRAKVLGI